MKASAPALRFLLRRRCRQGKEDAQRLGERQGRPGQPRPPGSLVWFHAASVGESQSTLILVHELLARHPDLHILVTTGTLTSAELMRKRLPERAVHQFYPLDHPAWVRDFLDHWRPDLALWMESEIWPNMLLSLQERKVPALLVNARLSEKSARRWHLMPRDIKKLLGTFSSLLTQTDSDAEQFRDLGAQNVICTGNLKYAAHPLPYDVNALEKLQNAIGNRPVWLYASTHKGEEDLACRLHRALKKSHPDLLTIIVPRHPERGPAIRMICEKQELIVRLRGTGLVLPEPKDDIYVADTLGELGLFYRLCPIACIGRSFSDDGGGGHNPIEAAQLGCAVLTGPRTQNLQQIFDDMKQDGALLVVNDERDFLNRLDQLMTDHEGCEALRSKAKRFAAEKARVLEAILDLLTPYLDRKDSHRARA